MIQFPTVIAQVKTMADGTIRLTLDLPEVESEGMTELFNLRGKEIIATLREES